MLLGQERSARPMTEDEREFFIELGRRLAALRTQHGLTQAQVAEQLGVSQQTVNSMEKGRRRVPVSALPIFAEIFDISLEELIEGDKAKPQKRGPASKLQRQMEQIKKLPRAKQRFVIEMLDAVIAQAQRSGA